MKRLARPLAIVVLCTLAMSAPAQTTRSVTDGYEDNIKAAQTVTALGVDLFGEQVNLKDGATSFRAVDVSVKTNSGLPMAVGRVLGINARDYDQYSDFVSDGELIGNWKLDVPYMHGVFDEGTGWISGMSNPQQRCSVSSQNTAAPPDRPSLFHNGANAFLASQYWAGNQINIPGVGEENLLFLPATQTRPTDGRTYYGTTKSNWRVSCLPAVLNGVGEGFLVVLPDGTKYTFNWFSSRRVGALMDTFCDGASGGTGTCGEGIGMFRREYFLHATRVEDRFGNWVAYQYNPANPRQLTSVTSSDGASIALGYAGGKLISITAGSRVWQYQYTDTTRTVLSAVILPDGNRWSFAYNNIQQVTSSGTKLLWLDCNPSFVDQSQPPPLGQSVVLTHPSGAVGTFKFRKLTHGTDSTPGGCYDPNVDKFGDEQVSEIVAAYRIPSLYEKTVTGPGLGTETWAYLYYPSWSWSPSGYVQPDCAQSQCSATSSTQVTAPDGVVTRYVFGNDYWVNAGQLLEVHVIKDAVTAQSTYSTYLPSATGQPFPDRVGYDPNTRNNPLTSEKQRPLNQKVLRRDGVDFASYVNTYDAYARPLSVTKSSSLGYSKAEVSTYFDHLASWVLGQTASVTTQWTEAGQPKTLEVSRADYDAATALPLRIYSFGKLQQTLGYYADGTLSTAADGAGNTTTLSGWKRGIPQSIIHADGKAESAVVSNQGWVDSTTDETNAKTCYGYDAMGRLTSITQPSEATSAVCDTSTWSVTTLTFAAVAAAEYGLPAGHWKQTISTGNARKVIYLDALWRPVVTEQYDTANIAGTLSQSVTRYDIDGHPVFQSYPRNTLADYATVTQGTRTTYDALDRVTRVEQDSELGVLATITEYLTGFQRRITSPRGFATTQSFQVYDEPMYEVPLTIDAPEGVSTTIARDVFGKPTQVTRSGPGG